MVTTDIRTRVELKNETIRETGLRGKAGKVALIGAFPSKKQNIFAATSFPQIVSHYGIQLNSRAMKDYGGVKAARRLFMDGIDGYNGATSVTCANICTLKPSKLGELKTEYRETYDEDELIYDVDSDEFIVTGTINSTEPDVNQYVIADTELTFDKLQRALNQLADEDMDILFIAHDLWDIFKHPRQTYTTWKNNTTGQVYKIPIYKYILNPDGTPTVSDGEDVVNSENLIHYWNDTDRTELRTGSSIPNGKQPLLHSEILNNANQVTNYEIKRDANGEKIFLMENLVINDETIYGITPTGKYIHNIGDVYDYILDFIDNEFTTHRPVNYVGAIFTRANVEEDTITGIKSKYIRVRGKTLTAEDEDEGYVDLNTPCPENEDITLKTCNPHINTKVWGAVEIANLFTRETNEISTCGLFYQEGIINGEEVDRIELAAHMCGFICSLPLGQDLTYQTIPGLTDIKEEAYLGQDDAGTVLNEHGIQIIRPKDRLNKTFYVNNSVQPTGWHTNHVRSVTYLLKRLQFEDGLGMNNILKNIEAYHAVLENICKEVIEETDVIESVTIGEIQVINHYRIFIPISIVLAGVITRINVGVSMALDEGGTTTTYIKTTSGYSVNI